jgi:DNA-binding NtrC family response regulator
MEKQILIVTPEISLKGSLEKALRDNYKFTNTRSSNRMLSLLKSRSKKFDFILIDSNIFNTLEPSTLAKLSHLWRIIVTVKQGDFKTIKRAMDSGVYACVKKPLDTQEIQYIFSSISLKID